MENKYPGKKCHEMVEMPNHFHCILEIIESTNSGNDNGSDAHAGAPLRGRPPNKRGHPENGEKYGIHNIKYDATIVTIYPVLCILNFLLWRFFFHSRKP